MKKLIFISPFLLNKKGHYYHIAKSLHDSSLLNDIDFRAILNKECTLEEPWAEKAFRTNPYLPFFTIKKIFSIINKIRTSGNSVSKDGGPVLVAVKSKSFFNRFLVNVIDVLNILYMNVFCYLDLKKSLKNENINSDVSLFIEFPHKYSLFGLWLWLKGRKEKPHLFLNFTAPQKSLRMIKFLFGKNSDFLCHSFSQAKKYEYIINTKVYALDQPVIFGEIPNMHENKKRTFGIVGTLRVDRGLYNIPLIVENSLKDVDAHFIVHGNVLRNELNTTEVVDKLTKLQRRNEDRFQLILSELSEKEYFQLLNNIDVVLLPYGTETYGMVGSGVFAECAAIGKIVIVPYYVEPSDDEYFNKCCWKVHSNSSDDFVSAIKILSEGEPFNTMKKEAEKMQPRLKDKFNPNTYLYTLLRIRNNVT